MGRARTIQIFLPEGNPRGIRVAVLATNPRSPDAAKRNPGGATQHASVCLAATPDSVALRPGYNLLSLLR
jgi:hypothetical protein